MRLLSYASCFILVACQTPNPPTPVTPVPTAVPVTPVPTSVPVTPVPIVIPTPVGRLAEIINIINSGGVSKGKYIVRPVLSTKDTKKLKGQIKGIREVRTQQAESTPQIVDLFPYDTYPKNQGSEGLCTAFAVSAAMEMNGVIKYKHDINVSERHLWSKYQEYYTVSALDAAKNNWVTKEAVWPYNSGSPTAAITDFAKNSSYQELSDWDAVWVALKNKKAVVLSVDTNTSWSNPYRGILSIKGTKQGGHAVKVSGFFDTQKGRYLIIKNSWGKNYGDGGYAYLPLAYCSKLWCALYAIDSTEYKNVE